MFKSNRFLVVIMALLLSASLLSGCSLTSDDSDDTSGSASLKCLSADKDLSGDTQLKATLVDSENQEVTKSTVTMAETEDLQYGMTGEQRDSEYYGTYELCNLDTGEYLEEGEYVYEAWTLFEVKSNPAALSESSGNSTYFIHEVEGEERNYIPGPGRYAVNTYRSAGEGEEWEWTDTIEFTVVE